MSRADCSVIWPLVLSLLMSLSTQPTGIIGLMRLATTGATCSHTMFREIVCCLRRIGYRTNF
jgi:hypothetical protein